jgi:hypothetical protein
VGQWLAVCGWSEGYIVCILESGNNTYRHEVWKGGDNAVESKNLLIARI